MTWTEAAAFLMAAIALGGLGIRWWRGRHDDRKATIEYWQGVAEDLRRRIEALESKDIVHELQYRRLRNAFEYLAGEVAAEYPSAVKIAREIESGVTQRNMNDIAEAHD